MAGKPHRDKVLGWWLLPLPTIDPASWRAAAPRSPAYGPRFTYSHYAGTKKPWYAAGVAIGAGALMATAQVPPLRNFLLGRIKQGDGPDEARRAKSWFSVDFVGEGDGRTVHTRVRGGDPGYGETSKMLAESALCLAFDDNPKTVRLRHHRPGDGRQPDGPPDRGGHQVRDPLTGGPPPGRRSGLHRVCPTPDPVTYECGSRPPGRDRR